MFLIFGNKRYYVLDRKRNGQIILIDGPFLSIKKPKMMLKDCDSRWVELLTVKQLANLLSN